MRALVLLGLLLVALTAAAPSSSAAPAVSLRVTFWEDGAGEPDAVWTLRCGPPRGSLPRPARACRKLATLGARVFAMTPPNAICTEIYGGPQEARVTGRIGQARIWTTVTRTNGCEIERWQRLSPWLLPPGGAS